MSSVSIAGNTSGSVTLSAPDVAGSTTLTLPTTSGTVALTASPTFTGTVTTPSLTFSDGSTQTAAASPFGLKNRIINGDMVISQRNGTSSVTIAADGTYTLDRWRAGQSQNSRYSVQQSTVAPAGFVNSLLVTSLAATSVGAFDTFTIGQFIEGFNVADLNWGTANAQTVTLSFRVRSSLTGTFSGAVTNSAFNRGYPFTYTISSANTWETKTVTITGDTTGTWATNNTSGLNLYFSLGSGSAYSGTAGAWAASGYTGATSTTNVVATNGATFYITGVQLERNTTATPFEWLPYSTELALCQRYCNRIYLNAPGILGIVDTTTSTIHIYYAPVVMRTTPTLTTTGTASNYQIRRGGGSTVCSAVPTFDGGTSENNMLFRIVGTVASGLTAGQACFMNAAGSETYLILTAEL